MKAIYILLLVILFVGCTKSENDEIIEISPKYFVDQKITLADIAEDIEYIPLSSENLFRFVLNPQLSDSLIIFNGGGETGILAHNKNGSFIRKIGRRGRGPGEYLRGVRFTVDAKNQNIYLLESGNLIVYDFNGKLVRDKKASTYSDFSEIIFHDNKLYLFARLGNSTFFNSTNYWLVLDTLGIKITSKKNTTKGLPENPSITSFGQNLAYKFDNKIFYQNAYNDTIFEIQDTLYKAAYLFKHDEYRLTPEISGNVENLGQNKHYVIDNLFESQHYLFIRYRQYNKIHFCIYDKQEKIFRNYTIPEGEKVGLINDIDGGLPFPFEKMVKLNNIEYLINSINPFELKEYVGSDDFKNSTPKYPEKKKQLEQLANSLDENDNPVLMLVKLKE